MAVNESEIRIRPMVQDDIDAVFEIDKRISSVERSFTYSDLIEGYIGGQIGCSIVAEENDQLVGFVLAAINYIPEQIEEACLIKAIGIDPDHRRRGIASQLIKELVNSSRSKGVHMVRILIDQHDSELQGLFESLDFRRGRLIDYSMNL